jgi:multicomponent Na+:H+ antiporter subunit G
VRALVIDLLSWALISSGAFFTVTGMIGLLRMPDLFTRLHAASVTDTLGAGLLCGGLMLQAGPTLVAAKLLFILALLFFTGPAITHALAQAALHAGVKPHLTEDRRERSATTEAEQPGRLTSSVPAAQ